MTCVAVTYLIQAGREGDARDLFAKLAAETRREPGCRLYLVHSSPDDPRRFFLYEQYDDPAALEAHRATPHFDSLARNGLFPITEQRTPEIYELADI